MRATSSLLVLTLVLAACGTDPGAAPSDPTTTEVPTTQGNEGGFGAPSQSPGEFQLGTGKPVMGTLNLEENGCWYAEINGTERLAVFPPGFEQSPEDGGELIDVEGAVYGDGDRFDASGSVLRGTEIPRRDGGRWDNYMNFCQPDLDELIVFDSLVHEFDPTALTTDELIVMLEEATWTEHHQCGRGWATSTADQRVGLVVYESTSQANEIGAEIVLPHPEWNASVLIGKNLFSEHCNDAIEEWISLPTIAARWPLTAGTITIFDEVPGPDENPALVRASLEGGRVDTGGALVALPAIDLDNPSFNFFAG